MDEKDERRGDREPAEEKAKRAREELHKVPPPGTDPLHEGP